MEYQPIAAIAAEPARASFSIDAAALSAAVDYLAKRVTERRNTIPILSHVLIEADVAGSITVTATDLDQEATITLAAFVDVPGAFCTDGANLAAMLAKLRKASKGALARFVDEGPGLDNMNRPAAGRVALSSGHARFTLPRESRDNFPAITMGEPLSLSRFVVPAPQFIADLAALDPAISTEEHRYYLNGIAFQVRNLAGRDRLTMAATDGHAIAVASRPIPAGAEALADSILPRKAVDNLIRAAKLANGVGEIGVEFTASKMRFTLGPISFTSKLIDRTFPDWEAPFTSNLAPTDGEQAAMFPDLLPGANIAALNKLAKGAPGAITWQPARDGLVGTVAGDDGLLFGAMALHGAVNGREGFAYQWNGAAEARAYLEALAASRGLPDAGEIEARCEAFTVEPLPGEIGTPNTGASFWGVELAKVGDRVVGLTVSGRYTVSARCQTVTDWDALCERTIQHPGEEGPIEGSYSILMPADGPGQLTVASAITGPDGIEYPVAMSESAIHLSKEQVRALIGESCFETMELPALPASHPLAWCYRGPVFVTRWTFEQGDGRLLAVQPNGRCFDPAKMPQLLLERAEIDALLAGTWEQEGAGEAIPETVAEICSEICEPVAAPAAEQAPYRITEARYAQGKRIIHTKGDGGYKSRACRLAGDGLGLHWTGRCKGYVASPAQAERFERLYRHGFDASAYSGAISRHASGVRELTWRDADKLARRMEIEAQNPGHTPEREAIAPEPIAGQAGAAAVATIEPEVAVGCGEQADALQGASEPPAAFDPTGSKWKHARMSGSGAKLRYREAKAAHEAEPVDIKVDNSAPVVEADAQPSDDSVKLPERGLAARLAEIEARLAAIESATPVSVESEATPIAGIEARWPVLGERVIVTQPGYGGEHGKVIAASEVDRHAQRGELIVLTDSSRYLRLGRMGENWLPEPATPIAEPARRTPAHERAVRRAWWNNRLKWKIAHSMNREGDARYAERERRRRAVRRAWAERKRRGLDAGALLAASAYVRKVEAERDAERDAARDAAKWCNHWKREHDMRATADRASARIAEEALGEVRAENADLELRLVARQSDVLRNRDKRRRAVTLARHRGQQMVLIAGVAKHADAALAELKRKLADPTSPERASDIAQLRSERDMARTANTALQQRCERAEAMNVQCGDAIEALVSRVARAEAALRGKAA